MPAWWQRRRSSANGSAHALAPPSSRISGTSSRRIPPFASSSTISMPKAFCPAATGTAATDYVAAPIDKLLAQLKAACEGRTDGQTS